MSLPKKLQERIDALISEQWMNSFQKEKLRKDTKDIAIELWTEIERLRGALEFYADSSNYFGSSPVRETGLMIVSGMETKTFEPDEGYTAKKALTESKARFGEIEKGENDGKV